MENINKTKETIYYSNDKIQFYFDYISLDEMLTIKRSKNNLTIRKNSMGLLVKSKTIELLIKNNGEIKLKVYGKFKIKDIGLIFSILDITLNKNGETLNGVFMTTMRTKDSNMISSKYEIKDGVIGDNLESKDIEKIILENQDNLILLSSKLTEDITRNIYEYIFNQSKDKVVIRNFKDILDLLSSLLDDTLNDITDDDIKYLIKDMLNIINAFKVENKHYDSVVGSIK